MNPGCLRHLRRNCARLKRRRNNPFLLRPRPPAASLHRCDHLDRLRHRTTPSDGPMTSAPTHLAKAALTGRVKDSRRGRDWRHSSSKPIIDALYLWLDRQLTQVQGRSGSCRGDPLWTRAMAWADVIPARRPRRARRPIQSNAQSPAPMAGGSAGRLCSLIESALCRARHRPPS